ncbi:hypothetical protein [Haladaptatus salinisoli]|uniref:hypothetical protein n=1 Tax=Haladaptatus salinisoli TaxID=2884876 RepID=UPI001D0A1002|nr:hypothetical protein [Haladaptatus salinisoli]
MVSDAIWAAAIAGTAGVAGSVLTAIVGYYRTKKRLDDERTRWRADHWMDKKVEVLTELAVAELECYRAVRNAGNDTHDSYDEMDESVRPALSRFTDALTTARIYLTEDEIGIIESTIGKYKIFLNDLARRVNGEIINLPWDDTEEAHNEAYSVLSSIVNPDEDRES